MKTWILVPLLCVCAATFHAQEATAQNESTLAANASEAAPDATQKGLTGAFDWKLRLQPGQKWEIRSFTRMTQHQNLAPEAGGGAGASKGPSQVDIQVMQRIKLDYDVLSLDKFGASTVRLTYREIMSDTYATAEGKPYPDEKHARQHIVFDGIDGASLTVKQAPDGTVWNVSGFDALQSRLLNAMPNLTPAEKVAAEKATSQFASDKYWRRFMSSLSGSLPKFPVMVSESWNYNLTTPADLPIQLSYQGKRTLNARKDGVAFVQEQATIDSGQMNLGNLGNGKNEAKVALTDYRGTINGATQVSEATGLPLSSNMTYKLSGVVEVELPARPGQSQNAGPMKMKTAFDVSGDAHTVMERKN